MNKDGTTNYGSMKINGGGHNRQIRVQCGGVRSGNCTNSRSYVRSLVFEAALRTLRENLKEPKVIEAFLREHSSHGKAVIRKKKKEFSRLKKLLDGLHGARENLAAAIKSGGDHVYLIEKLSEVQLQIDEARQQEDALRAGTYEFKIHAPSAASYLKLVEETLERLTTAPAKEVDLAVMEELNALVERIVVHPKDGREFEVEVVGKLARFVSGSDSFRGEGSRPNNIVKSGTLTAEDGCRR